MMNTKEIWQDIIEYKGMYQVSNLGRVKSLKRKGRNKERILKSSIDYNDYLHLSFSKNNTTKCFYIHKLMAMAFLNHKPNGQKLVVDHINNIRNDNRLENLQLINQRENTSKDRKGGSSKYVGVCWSKQAKKWLASITINNKQKHLGLFTNEIEAHLVYQKALNDLNCKD